MGRWPTIAVASWVCTRKARSFARRPLFVSLGERKRGPLSGSCCMFCQVRGTCINSTCGAAQGGWLKTLPENTQHTLILRHGLLSAASPASQPAPPFFYSCSFRHYCPRLALLANLRGPENAFGRAAPDRFVCFNPSHSGSAGGESHRRASQ